MRAGGSKATEHQKVIATSAALVRATRTRERVTETGPFSLLRNTGSSTLLAVAAASSPSGIASGVLIQLCGHLDQGARDVWIAGIILAFIGVDVPFLSFVESGKSLISVAVGTLNGYVSDIDHVDKEPPKVAARCTQEAQK